MELCGAPQESNIRVQIYRKGVEVPARNNLYERGKVKAKRLEKLRLRREQEVLDSLKEKPTILDRSRELARLAEQKFFQQFQAREAVPAHQPPAPSEAPTEQETPFKLRSKTPTKTPPKLLTSQEAAPLADPPFQIESKDPPIVCAVSRPAPVLRTNYFRPKPPRKPRAKSIYSMTVLERSEYWVEQRARKLQERSRRKAEEETQECTFTPACYSRSPQQYRQYERKKSLEHSGTATLFSVPSSQWVECPEYLPLSPCQQRVAFKEGCNFAQLLSS